MDFSSPARALLSLDRRRPALPEDVLDISKPMFNAYTKLTSGTTMTTTEEETSKLTQEYLQGVYALLSKTTTTSSSTTNMRWEALAVALFCGTGLLEGQTRMADATATTQDAAHKASTDDSSRTTVTPNSVYIDGPRVPSSTASHPATALMTNGSTSVSTAAAANVNLVKLSSTQTMELATILHQTTMEHLEHKEPRIRTLVARAVGAHAAYLVYLQKNSNGGNNPHVQKLQEQVTALHDRVVASIQEHMQQGQQVPDTNGTVIASGSNEEEVVPAGQAKMEDDESAAGDSENDNDTPTPKSVVLDDTTGWRALETNWQSLACLCQPLGGLYFELFPLMEGKLLSQCQSSAVDHINRHVRAAAMLVLEQWVRSAAQIPSGRKIHPLLIQTVTAVLKDGLADNWSQVRMAASVLCRAFFLEYLSVHPNPEPEAMYAVLIPRMCLNRFYLAQGVKLYSHDSWRQVFKENGLELVAKNVGPVCRYYVKMCDANNHVVREGACQAVAELATKLSAHSPETLQPYVPMLLQALLMCFHDESWPVRDEASLACGLFCKAYPEECREELNMLWERWTEQLTDQIWSVRENAAVALGDAMQAYGKEIHTKCVDLVKKLLPSAKDQPAMTMEEFKAKQNDIVSHTDAQLYSCGSLAPKLSKKSGAGRIGCGNCAVSRPKAPWEATDGAIYLLRELTVLGCDKDSVNPDLVMTDDMLLPLLTELADVCRVQHFPQGDDLRATLWRQLPGMAVALGKQRFKRLYLDIFMDLLISNLERTTASALSKHAAGQCAEELAQLLGPSIFRGRLDDYQQAAYDRAMRERQQVKTGPMDAFSPFGPPGMLDPYIVNQ